MGFNKFNTTDVIRILIVFFLMAVVYFSFGSNLWSRVRQMVFQAPTTPPTLTGAPIPTKTQTPAPTGTSEPTATFTPTPIPTSAFLPGEVVSFWNEFDNTDPLRGDWVLSPNARVENGMLVIEHSDDWSGVYGNAHLSDGQVILIKFRFEVWSDLHFAVETGEYETDTYRSWGVGAESNIFSPAYSEGTVEYADSFAVEDLELDPGKWYVLMLVIGGKEPFLARIWEYGNIDKSFNLQLEMDETWQGKQWLPLFLAGPQGKIEIERYEELKSYGGS